MKKKFITVLSCLCLLGNAFAQEQSGVDSTERIEKLEQENKAQNEVEIPSKVTPFGQFKVPPSGNFNWQTGSISIGRGELFRLEKRGQ